VRKSTVEEIRQRFDADVERFSVLETGQVAAVDARLGLDLVTQAAAATTPHARSVLDIGCGAGNYTLRLLEELPHRGVDCTLIDLSRPMLDRAVERLAAYEPGDVEAIQGDIREVELPPEAFDIVLAAAVLHHLRTPEEWEAVFGKIFASLRPGGSFWVFDLVSHENSAVEGLMRARYGDYLKGVRDEAYRDQVFDYIEKEDTPAPLSYQLDLMRRRGFEKIDVLHVNSGFAAFGGMRL
jgi:tRNA (cmo5U34)-methyltransferase